MERIAIYGTGTIGVGLATLLTGNSIPTLVVGRSPESLTQCCDAVGRNWNSLIENRLVTTGNRDAAMALLTVSEDPLALADRTFVFEAVSESPDAKREIYRNICRHTGPETVVASTTSSLDAGILAGLTERPEWLLIAHPFQPAHMLPLFEVVCHENTSQDAIERTCALLESMHRQIVQLRRSVPGFLVNRLAQALFRESIYLIETEVATAQDIDKAIKYAVGMRYASIGLLEYFDDVGFALESTIAENIYPDLCSTSELQKTHLQGLASGNMGLSAGKGFYDWSQKDLDEYFFRKQTPFFSGVKEWNLPI